MRVILREALVYHSTLAIWRRKVQYIFPQLLLGGLIGQAAVHMVGISLAPCGVEPKKATHTCIPSCPLAHMAPGQGTASDHRGPGWVS